MPQKHENNHYTKVIIIIILVEYHIYHMYNLHGTKTKGQNDLFEAELIAVINQMYISLFKGIVSKQLIHFH